MANPNWATLALWRGADVDAALGVAKVTLDNWRSAQNDLWNVAGLAGGAGYGAGGGRAWRAVAWEEDRLARTNSSTDPTTTTTAAGCRGVPRCGTNFALQGDRRTRKEGSERAPVSGLRPTW